ncbi:hypothetical protein J4461_00450 [Candidatus Pacearchaeota archaeon]|nr:hypothetical protein [Candidatus Pacearchaeota archaeon]
MGILRKKSSDFEILDLTLLQKRGILKVPEIKPANISNSDGFVDFTSQNKSESSENTNVSSFSPFGMLDNALSQSPSISDMPKSSLESSSELNALKLKIDDFEFKFEKILERLDKIESRL